MTRLLLAGVDEVGRGPLAGPVITAAVMLDCRHTIAGLADSKQLTAKKRQLLDLEIRRHALCYSIGRADVDNHAGDAKSSGWTYYKTEQGNG